MRVPFLQVYTVLSLLFWFKCSHIITLVCSYKVSFRSLALFFSQSQMLHVFSNMFAINKIHFNCASNLVKGFYLFFRIINSNCSHTTCLHAIYRSEVHYTYNINYSSHIHNYNIVYELHATSKFYRISL